MSHFVMQGHEVIIKNFLDNKFKKEYPQKGPNDKMGRVAISFREAGQYTIARLNQGCKCKGHTVLEKSIKEKTITNATIKAQDIQNVNELFGLIGHWEEEYTAKGTLTSVLLGVYLSEKGVEKFEELEKNGIKKYGKLNNIVEISPELIKLIGITEWDDIKPHDFAKYFLTGDYDIHDILRINLSASGESIIGAEESCNIFMELNQLLKGSGNGSLEDESNYIRHGAQINYPIFMFRSEPGKVMPLPVIRADNHILMFIANEDPVEITSNEELVNWYKEHKINIKSTFDEENQEKIYNLYFLNLLGDKIVSLALQELCGLYKERKITNVSGKIEFTKKASSGLVTTSQGLIDSAHYFYINAKANGLIENKEVPSLFWRDVYSQSKSILKAKYEKAEFSIKSDEVQVVEYAKKFIIMLNNERRLMHNVSKK